MEISARNIIPVCGCLSLCDVLVGRTVNLKNVWMKKLAFLCHDLFWISVFSLQNEGPVRIQFKMSGSHLCIPEKWNCYFQNRIIMFCLLVPTLTVYTCERFIYFQDRSAYSAAGKSVDWSWEYINCSQTHECGNWDWGRAIPRKRINKWDFRCSVRTKNTQTTIFWYFKYFCNSVGFG
jgi:hypothetical protein